jgi:hypothetical protein
MWTKRSPLRRIGEHAATRDTTHLTRHEKALVFIQKHAYRLAWIGLVLTLAQALYANWAIISERNDRRDQLNSAICSLVRAVPEGNDRIDGVRKSFHCGPYRPPSLDQTSGRSPQKPAQQPRATVTIRPSRTPRAGRVPVPAGLPTRTRTEIRTSTAVKNGPTTTVTRVRTETVHPAPKTVTSTRTVTRVVRQPCIPILC